MARQPAGWRLLAAVAFAGAGRERAIRRAAWKGAAALIVANAGSLVGTQAVTSAVGYVYWGVAARGFAPAAIGVGATALSATLLLGTAATLGLGTLLVGELPRRPDQAGALTSASLGLSFGAGALLGLVAALVAPALSPDFAPFARGAGARIALAVGVGLSASTLVLDQALIGLLLGGMQLARNALFAVAKLAAIYLVWVGPLHKTALTLYGTWVAGQLVSLAVLGLILATKRASLPSLRPAWGALRGSIGKALAHHWLNVALQAPSLTLPLIVTVVLTASLTAYFYTAWMVTSMVFVAPIALVTALYAVGSRDPSALASRTRLTLTLATLTGVVANVVLFVAAPAVLRLFGPGYAEHGTQSLRLLALAVFPLLVKDHYVTIRRIRGQTAGAAGWSTVGGLFELVVAGIGGSLFGLAGISLGYVLGVSVEALCMGRLVVQVAAQGAPPAAGGRAGMPEVANAG